MVALDTWHSNQHAAHTPCCQGGLEAKKPDVVDIASPSIALTPTQQEPTLPTDVPMEVPADTQPFDLVTEPAVSPAALPAEPASESKPWSQDAQPRDLSRVDTKSWDESLDLELELITEVTYKGFPESLDMIILAEPTLEPFKSVEDAMSLKECLAPTLSDGNCPLVSLCTDACRWLKRMDETPGDGDSLPLNVQKAIRLLREMYASCARIKEQVQKDSAKLAAANTAANSSLDSLKTMREAGKIKAEALRERRLTLQKWLQNTQEKLKFEADESSKAHGILRSDFAKALEELVTTAKHEHEIEMQKAALFSEHDFFAELDQVMTMELQKNVTPPEKTCNDQKAPCSQHSLTL